MLMATMCWSTSRQRRPGRKSSALANTFLASGTDLGLVPHPFRRCAYVEGAAVLLQERDEVENVRRSLAYLEHCQLPDDAGLYEMNLFMLRPGEAGGRFLDLWWQQFQRLGRRDQLLVPPILQELGLAAFGLMRPGQSVRDHPGFRLRAHGQTAHKTLAGLLSSTASLARATIALAHSFTGFFSIRSLPEIATKAIALLKREGLSGLYGVMREEFVAESAYRRAAMQETTDAAQDEARYAQLRYRPRLSVLMPVYDPPERLLRDAIESVRRQGYPDWELCIADDASPSAHIRRVLEEVAEEDTRIRLVFRESNGHISAASNSALGLVTGEFVVLLDHDDELADDALLTLAEVISGHPEVDVIYSDEDKIDASGRRHRAYFKPEWNPDLFCGQNLISHLGTYRTERVRAVGGFREGYEGSQDWDLAARIIDDQPPPRIYHIPRVLYHWRVIPGSTALNVDEKNYAISAARRTIEDHCRRNGWSVMLERVNSAQFRVRHYPAQPQPLVSLVLYNLEGQDTAVVLERLYDATTYRPLEFVLCGLAQFPELSTRVSKTACSVVGSPESGSLSNSLNRAVQVSHGEILCLFDTSLQPRSVDWLDELVGHACREEIGAVGGQQTDPRGLIRHAGYVLDDEQLVVEPYVGRAEGLSGYRNRARLVQNLSAVSGACLAVRRDVWDDVSGLDTERFADACVDIDLCLRLLDCGFCNLWTPYAVATATRAPYLQAALASAISKSSPVLQGLREEHAALLSDDPASNPNLEIRNGMPQFRVR